MITLGDALKSIAGNSEWVLRGDTLAGLEWMDETKEPPTEAEVESERARMQTEYARLEYQRLRSVEYPPASDYLDGIVKGDQAQVQAYIDACLAVKAKYPKPSEAA